MDQGWQYQMSVYRKALQKHSVMQNMSRRRDRHNATEHVVE
ncbi:Transposase (plasmid) [Mycetohabitans rhizoxinica HKI 454]|uniref:Transposase n=1 Tax=Mycetohabitans rhizoxinica (strain DSM 19002 / CIP 109453 / HKI 454) TaxID=882378 RepID=E5AUU0_MYCRK|nr:Transposase [Mycetohabitans rhizoxinica HKI 454]